ncbi:P-loop NTPase fold protein [Streptomyces rishiriensis]|uniref:P-loop NTPase fold protein n=1 Tax=Streptomyces rishiriensis TaxID=68264 RepID=UPI0037A2853D
MTSNGALESDSWLPTQPGGIYALTSWQDDQGRSYLASGGSDGDVRLWNAVTGEPLCEPLIGHRAAVRNLASWTAGNGTLVFSSGSDGRVCLWNAQTGTLVDSFPSQHSGGVMSMTLWSESGALRLATGSYDGSVHVWDPIRKVVLWTPWPDSGPSVISLASAQQGDGKRYLAAGTDAGTVGVWDVGAMSPVIPASQGHSAPAECLLWVANNGDLALLSGGEDGEIKQWAPPEFHTLDWNTGVSGSPLWSMCDLGESDGRKQIASGNTNGEIQIWDVETRSRCQVIPSGLTPISALERWRVPGTDSVRIAAASTDGVIRIWNPSDGSLTREIDSGHVAAIWALAGWQESDEDSRLASAGLDGLVRVWNPDAGTLISVSAARHGPGVWALAAGRSVDGHRVLSGSLDGTIKVWDPADGAPLSTALKAHTASVSDMTCWAGPDGLLRVASVGDDAAFRLLSTPAGEVDIKRVVHNGGLLAITDWVDAEGARRVASAGTDHVIRVWDGETGEPVGAPIDTATQGIWSLCSWIDEEGNPRIAAGSFDGLVTVWDPAGGGRVGDPFQAEDSAVRGLTCWTNSEGRVRIASGGAGGIHVWDALSWNAVCRPLLGHTSGVRTMVSWRRHDGSVRLASGGDDGTIRLWDPEQGVSLRTVEVGAISIWGVSDAPATADLLDRAALASAIAGQITSSGREASSREQPADGGLTGPAVITVEGPWGSGKSTLMHLVRRSLEAQPSTRTDPAGRAPRRLTVREVMGSLRRNPESDPGGGLGGRRPGTGPRSYATAWFNPWAHQSGEQVWAGLAQTIIEAAAPVLYPTDAHRERYWLKLNLKRMDNYRALRAVRKSVASPLLGASLLAVGLPLAIALLQFNGSVSLLGEKVNSSVLALTLPIAFLVAGIVHTWVRYWRGWAVTFMPEAIFRGPIQAMSRYEAASGASASVESSADPLSQADRGSLYLWQHDVMRVLSDITESGYEFVVFIDDLDRCQAATTAEVIEAVNIFLSGLAGSGVRVRFVIGMDPTIIATHLDRLYGEPENPTAGSLADDPSIGWAFLRKLSQLPVPIPYIGDQGLDRFIDVVTGAAPVPVAPSPPVTGTSVPAPRSGSARPATSGMSPATPAPAQRQAGAGPTRPGISAPPVDVIAWRTLEQHPRIRAFLRERLVEQPDRSIRDAKRLINVWQLYVRMTAAVPTASTESDLVDHGCRLVVLAEIVTRWPALHSALHRRSAGRSGLQYLAAATGSDEAWSEAVRRCDIDAGQQRALANLRSLLTRYDGPEVADIALLVL